MKHRIETNVPASWADSVKLKINQSFHASRKQIEVLTPTGSTVVVVVHGNGAMLRDVAELLDRAGMLD